MNMYEKKYHQTLEKIEKGKRISPLFVIKLFCQECMGFHANEVKDCKGEKCILYKFRFGKNKSGKRGHQKLEIGKDK